MTPGCTCSPRYQRWQPDGTCSACGNVLREVQIMDVVRAVLIADPLCALYRNEVGHNTHFPDGTKRKRRIEYGICNPGGADLLGCYGPRYLAVEVKTPRGSQSPDQIAFERAITKRGSIYALARSADDARALLAWLQAGAAGALPERLQGEGGQLQTEMAQQ